ncbi:MAG: hypothetical protein H6R19_459 [Proteobacteria bacterium]|nr:hypothetical protein [Pseudomonadota bacterium]
MAGCRRLVTALILLLAALSVQAQSLAQQPVWSQLNAQQRTALAPLSSEWNSMSDARRQKWLGIARRYASLSPIEQARMQDRMREWVALTPAQRELARTQYKKLRSAPAAQKVELERKWQEYEALSSEEKQRLQAKPVTRITVSAGASQPAAPYATTVPKLLIQAPPSTKSARALAAVSPVPSSDQSR